MPNEQNQDTKSKKVLDDLQKMSEIRQGSLKLLLSIDKKISDYKLKKLREKLDGIKNGT